MTLNQNKGLSSTITTLIILISAVLIATLLSYFIVNVAMIRTETELLLVKKEHIWVNNSGAMAAFQVQNIGGKDVLIDMMAVNSIQLVWSDVYICRLPDNQTFNDEFEVVKYSDLSGSWFLHQSYNFTVVESDIQLKSGRILLVIIKDPDGIEVDDIGYPASISVFTTNSEYVKRCNIESAI